MENYCPSALGAGALKEHRWNLLDPCRSLKKHLSKKMKKVVEVFRFPEWEAIIEALEPYYRPVAKLMLLTGMIASEIAALNTANPTQPRILLRHGH